MHSPSLLVVLLLVACVEREADPAEPVETGGVRVDADGDGFDSASDCDDGNAAVNPGATELCGGVDEDCDGLIDDEDPDVEGSEEAYLDGDGDGRGDPDTLFYVCAVPLEAVSLGSDCDDADAAVHPAAPEVCNGKDDDCDGDVDDEDSHVTSELALYPDADGDGRGDGSAPREVCGTVDGWIEDGSDPDDADASVWLPPDVYVGDVDETVGSFCLGYGERKIEGDLELSLATAAEIEDLHCVSSVSGALWVLENPHLTDFAGLPNLTEVGERMSIEGNPLLIEVSGVGALLVVEGYLSISDNPVLERTSGLIALEEVGSLDIQLNPMMSSLDNFDTLREADELHITANDGLLDIPGFAALAAVGHFSISGNDGLLDVSGFANLERTEATTWYPEGSFTVANNDALLDISGFDAFVGTLGEFSIYGNRSLVEVTGLRNLSEVAGPYHVYENDSLAMMPPTGRGEHMTSFGVWSNPSLCQSLVDDRIESLEASLLMFDPYTADNLDGC